jgi:hypothetical protein
MTNSKNRMKGIMAFFLLEAIGYAAVMAAMYRYFLEQS